MLCFLIIYLRCPVRSTNRFTFFSPERFRYNRKVDCIVSTDTNRIFNFG